MATKKGSTDKSGKANKKSVKKGGMVIDKKNQTITYYN